LAIDLGGRPDISLKIPQLRLTDELPPICTTVTNSEYMSKRDPCTLKPVFKPSAWPIWVIR
jgi:hypothetical protein